MTATDAILVLAGLAAGAGIDMASAAYARRAGAAAGSTLSTKLVSGLTGGGIGLACAAWAPGAYVWFSAGFGGLLLALANIDLRVMLLPNRLNAAVLLLGA